MHDCHPVINVLSENSDSHQSRYRLYMHFFYLYFYLWIKVSCTCIFFYVKKNLYGEENGEREKKDINLMKVKTDSTREFEENNKRMGNRRMEERNQKKN